MRHLEYLVGFDIITPKRDIIDFRNLKGITIFSDFMFENIESLKWYNIKFDSFGTFTGASKRLKTPTGTIKIEGLGKVPHIYFVKEWVVTMVKNRKRLEKAKKWSRAVCFMNSFGDFLMYLHQASVPKIEKTCEEAYHMAFSTRGNGKFYHSYLKPKEVSSHYSYFRIGNL